MYTFFLMFVIKKIYNLHNKGKRSQFYEQE